MRPKWPKKTCAQVSVDGSRVCFEKLSGGVDGLIIRLALYCWKDWMKKACHAVLDGGVLHLDVGRTGVPICFAGKETLLVWRPNKTVVLLVGYSVV
jgi:hypothetical protein